MDMDEFAKVIKESKIAENRKVKIIYQLLQAAGSKSVGIEKSKQSPADGTIQRWLSKKGNKPKGSTYFYNSQIEDQEKAHKFLRETVSKDQWINLKVLFKQHHDINPSDEEFYIDTETEDFIKFSTSFWRQFASFFVALRMWDSSEEQSSEMNIEPINPSNDIANEMISIFKKKFEQYKVYEFIPKNIEDVINSLDIYYEILDEGTKRITSQDGDFDSDIAYTFIKVYCKLSPNFDSFVFSVVAFHDGILELKSSEGLIILKTSQNCDYNKMPTNTWLSGKFKYAFASQDIFKGQFDDETLVWKDAQGEVILLDVTTHIDRNKPVIEDCYLLIDKMLDMNTLIYEFVMNLEERIIETYEGIDFDNTSRLVYNNIKLYRKSLKAFENCLTKFRELEKEKSKYFRDQSLIQQFGIYAGFDNFESASKPQYPFADCYLNPTMARDIETNLRFYHKRLIELYDEILSKEEKYTK